MVFGVMDNEKKISIAASLQRVKVSPQRAVLYKCIITIPNNSQLNLEMKKALLPCLWFNITVVLL